MNYTQTLCAYFPWINHSYWLVNKAYLKTNDYNQQQQQQQWRLSLCFAPPLWKQTWAWGAYIVERRVDKKQKGQCGSLGQEADLIILAQHACECSGPWIVAFHSPFSFFSVHCAWQPLAGSALSSARKEVTANSTEAEQPPTPFLELPLGNEHGPGWGTGRQECTLGQVENAGAC